MTAAKLLADTNVVSYLFRNSTLGAAYWALIAGRPIGVSLLTLEEIKFGAAINRWSPKSTRRLDAFLSTLVFLPMDREIGEICSRLRAQRQREGRRIELPDAWNAATALWHEIPLVTHDRDLEGIPGLRVLTLHDDWRVREPGIVYGTPQLELQQPLIQ